MRIVLVTDAWLPQTNGVVRTLQTTVEHLGRAGHDVHVIEPGAFSTVPCPSYPEIRLSLLPARRVAARLRELSADAVHIATEGPLGRAARAWCMRNAMPFTTSYHTQFPEYLHARLPIGLAPTYAYLRRFHAAAVRTMVATPSLEAQLDARGFEHLVRWGRGVDTGLFRPGSKDIWTLPRPIWLYFGRVAIEKGLDDFLSLDLPGTQVVIGGGPALATLSARYPRAVFTGYKYGEDLSRHVAAADVFVFPSKTDTFGLVLLEAMACGLPVAAYPVTGPIDVVEPEVTGVLSDDLGAACLGALALDPESCRRHALTRTWEAATRQFLSALAPRTPIPVPLAERVDPVMVRRSPPLSSATTATERTLA